MKKVELSKVPNEKVGRILLNNAFLEPHEYRIILFLAEGSRTLKRMILITTDKTIDIKK